KIVPAAVVNKQRIEPLFAHGLAHPRHAPCELLLSFHDHLDSVAHRSPLPSECARGKSLIAGETRSTHLSVIRGRNVTQLPVPFNQLRRPLLGPAVPAAAGGEKR